MLLVSFIAIPASAAIGPEGEPGLGLVPDCERTQLKDNTIGSSLGSGGSIDPKQITSGPCTIYDFLQMLVNLIEWFFAILGAAAFLMFLYGGGLFVFSMGNPERTSAGKSVLVNTVLAMIVILGAYAAIKFIAVTLGLDQTIVNKVF